LNVSKKNRCIVNFSSLPKYPLDVKQNHSIHKLVISKKGYGGK
jgi:hypothetical protein